mgnify:CR=1 FL=1
MAQNYELIRKETENSLHVTFCKTCKTCPAVDISTDRDIVIIGGDDEGYTEFTKEEFKLFCDEVVNGTFDKYIN